jgi:1-acyl-sn-glycerol-3-phosphate acyltransferase
MQNIVIDKPYKFVPASRSQAWMWLLRLFTPRRLRTIHGVVSVDCHGTDKLLASLAAGHGVLIAPNHSRPCDPDVVQEMTRRLGVFPLFMASWHLFMQSRLQTFCLRRLGAFSIYREGMDRTALNTAIDILEKGARPLVIFPEGVVSRTNDHLNVLLEGTSFIARAAAKKRASATPPGQVVVHPVAIRYRYGGDVRLAIEPVLSEIEHRLSWRPQKQLSLEERIAKVGAGLLALKEIEYLGQPQTGTLAERLHGLIEGLLVPLDKEWLKGQREPHVVERIKKLRAAVVPDMAKADMPQGERARRWGQLADIYVAGQLGCYPPDYLTSNPTPDRLLETVERYEEDLTDKARVHAPIHATTTVGDAIVVSPNRERGSDDPVLAGIERQLKQMLEIGS